MDDERFVEEALTEDGIAHIFARLIERANEALSESRNDENDLFAAGRAKAYFKMLDILQSEFRVSEQDLEKFGLDVNLLQNYAGVE